MPASRRLPRSRSCIHDLIAEAATKLFCTHGFDAVTTRAIAAAADVTGAVLFRYFGTKSSLFEATVIDPFCAAITDLARLLRELEHKSIERVMHTYVSSLYDIFEDKPGLLQSIFTDRDVIVRLAGRLDDLEGAAVRALAVRGMADEQSNVSIRLGFGAVAFNAALASQLYPGSLDDRPGSGQVKSSLTAILLGRTAVPHGPEAAHARNRT